MIAELVAGAASFAAIAGWIFAFRARGESRAALSMANEAAERARIAEAARDAAQAKASDAEASRAAAAAELRSTASALTVVRVELEAARREKVDLVERLAKAGVPVGPTLIDSSVDRLYADKDRRGPEDRNPDRDEDRPGRPMSDDASDDPGDKAGPR